MIKNSAREDDVLFNVDENELPLEAVEDDVDGTVKASGVIT